MNSPASTLRALALLGLPLHTSCMADLDPVAVERGARLRRCRLAMDWTQAELSLETGWTPEDPDTGLSASRIGNFEQGTRRIGHEEAEMFGRVFEIPAAYFMALIDAKEAEVIAALRGLRARVPLDQAG